jgi:hypothetical protein
VIDEEANELKSIKGLVGGVEHAGTLSATLGLPKKKKIKH